MVLCMNVELCRDIDWLMSVEAFCIYAPCMYKPTSDKYIAEMTRYISDPSVRIYIGKERDKIVGMLVLREDSDASEIVGVAVSESMRKCGIGKNMISKVLETEHPERIIAQTDDDAVGFYRRCGFTDEKTYTEYPDGTSVRYNCTLNRRKNI